MPCMLRKAMAKEITGSANRQNTGLSAVKNIRAVRKQHMIHNSYLPTMEIDAQTYTVRADGQLLSCEPALKLPMAQRYFLF